MFLHVRWLDPLCVAFLKRTGRIEEDGELTESEVGIWLLNTKLTIKRTTPWWQEESPSEIRFQF